MYLNHLNGEVTVVVRVAEDVSDHRDGLRGVKVVRQKGQTVYWSIRVRRKDVRQNENKTTARLQIKNKHAPRTAQGSCCGTAKMACGSRS